MQRIFYNVFLYYYQQQKNCEKSLALTWKLAIICYDVFTFFQRFLHKNVLRKEGLKDLGYGFVRPIVLPGRAGARPNA
jgi:hypothetical protein